MKHKHSFQEMSDYLKSIGSTVVVPEDQLRSHYMKEVFADLPYVTIPLVNEALVMNLEGSDMHGEALRRSAILLIVNVQKSFPLLNVP